MKGIELSRRFFEEMGMPMLEEKFPDVLPYLAIGIVGSGSECFGFDDEISKDHDFEAGFCIFLPDESVVDRKTEFALERAYSKLPSEFMGVKRSILSPVGGNRHGVIRLQDFLNKKTGHGNGELSFGEWLLTPEQSLAEVTNGELFFDGLGEFTSVRKKLNYMPEDVRLKRLAGELLLMGQSGQYNYLRCIARNDTAAAQLAVFEFVKSAMHAVFLLNKAYMPYYKWQFRALLELPVLSELHSDFEYLISSDNSDPSAKVKTEKIEMISSKIICELRKQSLTDFVGGELEGHAYSVNDKISDSYIRNLHVLCAV